MAGWLATAFDSAEQDPRDYLKVEYGGLTLHIKPGHGDAVSVISTFLEDNTAYTQAQLVINRFLSAMAWKDGWPFATLGSVVRGALPTQRDDPWFGYSEKRVLANTLISQFDFEYLQEPSGQKQKLALALYREGVTSNMDFYGFLSFYKVINIGYANGHQQVAWINANLHKMSNRFAQDRLTKLRATESDIGTYLLRQGRDAIAHAFNEPILDPDLPSHKSVMSADLDLMRGLAEVFIEEELGVPSKTKLWREHLYELEGFKQLFGPSLVARLKQKEDVPQADFPAIPPLTLNLKEQPPYACLTGLPFQVAACEGGVVFLATDPHTQPMAVVLALDFPEETLEFSVDNFAINPRQEKYTQSAEACYFRFLVAYFCNGSLQIFNSSTGERLSHKLPLCR